MMSSLRNDQKMLENEFPTKRIAQIYNVSKDEKTAATGYLYMIRPSYNQKHSMLPQRRQIPSIESEEAEPVLSGRAG